MEPVIELKNECDGLDIEFDITPVIDISCLSSERERRIAEGIATINEELAQVEERMKALNVDIDRLANHADGIDYAISVTSGVVTGFIDVFFVGEWNFAEAKKESYKEINKKVIDFAKKQPDYIPYCNFALEGKGMPRRKPKDPDRLETAIGFLEWKFHLPGDGAYSTGQYGIDGYTHRLDDLCHHPTIVGLICCIIVQFTGSTMYVNKFGEDINIPISVNEYGNFVGNNPITKLFSGIVNWFITCAKTISVRKGHLMSDIATSASLPGSFLSTIMELASIPCFRNKDFLQKLRLAFKNGIGTGTGQINLGTFNALFEGAQSKLDITTEKAIGHELKRQALPVVINELLVRASYFIRRLIGELKEKRDILSVEWRNVIPFNNRTIVRMMTIATGTFTAIDMADAAIRSASKSVDVASFFANMILRVNFVGVGRFAVAVVSDVGMGVSRSIKRNERIKLQQERFLLLDAKVYYKQGGVWIAAEETGKSLEELYNMMDQTTLFFASSVADIKASLAGVSDALPAIEVTNPGLLSEMEDILKWG